MVVPILIGLSGGLLVLIAFVAIIEIGTRKDR